MFEHESFPVPLDTVAGGLYPSKFSRHHHRSSAAGGPSTFSSFPIPTRPSHSNASPFYPTNRQNARPVRSVTEELLGKGGGGGRGYYSSGLLPPSFISQKEEEEEEGRAATRRMEDSPFPDINEMTFPSPFQYRNRQGTLSRSHYQHINPLSGQRMFSHKMFSSHSSYPKHSHKRRGSFSSLVAYNVPPDFEAATCRGKPLESRRGESRRGSLSSPYYDESRYSGYMSL